ncbi:hypothetical protein GTA08_BOTSDO00261 [Neofusicoccum parvum]|uniref:Uncharacterized protein n=1 Tax=Neofusicoccum parvum TaxID=310453 RepID=A0ACB5S1V6_9PEZI|nr:hypothetical protein GTA08_BOTSDO00261 [Neofusicoccum parvum]
MAAPHDRPPRPCEHFHDPARNTYRYVHMPDTSWICERDPQDFDDALLQSLEQKRQELDAKVARYIAKKQGQFNDYVAEKNRRYDLRTEDRQKRRAAQQERDHEQQIAHAADDQPCAPQLMEDDNEASWFTKQREQDARKRAELVSEEVARSEPRPSDSPGPAPHADLGTVRERDSEILQLLPGFLPLLEDQEKLSSSAPAANRGDGRPPRNPRPLNFGREEIPQRPAASLGRRSSLTEEAKSAPKEPKKKKKKKVKTQPPAGLPTYTPPVKSSNAASLLSSSFVDANNTGIFYPTRTRPPPSHLRPDEASLSAVNVPLPVGGFSSESPTASYGSMIRGASLGESFMALNFARRMAEKDKAEEKNGGRKKTSNSGLTSEQPLLKEEDEEDEQNEEAERLARQREEKYRRDRVQDEDEFAGELDL